MAKGSPITRFLGAVKAKTQADLYTKMVLKPQIDDRKAFNQTMRGGYKGKVLPGTAQRAANFLAKGKPKIKW